ncbi:AAEL015537-PA [Aedes aegypti]|uniref:AAEL015537-PA n=1 Tax=Aedes aegypti TaxID=7159 RepID=Q1DGQ1_AEDAE|nr:AAEL015537-PA [Aedes aegypti]
MQKKNDGFASCVQNLYEDPALRDVTIVVDSDINPSETVSVQAHRVVLATMSDYFRAMLYGHFSERNQLEIRLFGVSHSAFQHCLRFMYFGFDGTLEKMSLDEGLEFYSLARMLLIDTKVKESFSEWVVANVTKWEKHLWKIFALAIEYDLRLIVSRCEEHLSDVANQLLIQDSFLTVPLTVVQKVLTCETLHCTKNELLLAIENWTNSKQIDDHVKQDMLMMIRSRTEPFFKGQKVNFYNSLDVDPQNSHLTGLDSSAQYYKTNMYFRKCIMLFGVSIVLKRNSESSRSINLKMEIIQNAVVLTTRNAVVNFDLNESASREVNIFFPAIKCCAYINYMFTFSGNGEGLQPEICTYGTIIHDLAKANLSHLVGIYHSCASNTGADHCESCQKQYNPNENEGRHNSINEYHDVESSESSYQNDAEPLSEHSFRTGSGNAFDETVSNDSFRNDSFNEINHDDESQDDENRERSYRSDSGSISANSFRNDSFNEYDDENESHDDDNRPYRNDSEYLSESSVTAESDNELEEIIRIDSSRDGSFNEFDDVYESHDDESSRGSYRYDAESPSENSFRDDLFNEFNDYSDSYGDQNSGRSCRNNSDSLSENSLVPLRYEDDEAYSENYFQDDSFSEVYDDDDSNLEYFQE